MKKLSSPSRSQGFNFSATREWTKAFDESLRRTRMNASIKRKVEQKRATRRFMAHVNELAPSIMGMDDSVDAVASMKHARRLRNHSA